MSSSKIGFWSVWSLVVGSQVGSSILTSPANLAPYGKLALVGWGISGLGAVMLALVFARLCMRIPRTGGPHAYVRAAFGEKVSFFTAWTYWIISWVSTTAVITAAVGYLNPILGDLSESLTLGLEIALLSTITIINLRGVSLAGSVEFFLSNLKAIPLLILPIVGLFFFKKAHWAEPQADNVFQMGGLLMQIIVLTLWGFIGLESATTPAGSVQQPEKTIPRAVIGGTVFVALLYMLNSLGIMGMVPHEMLAVSKAPYADVAKILYGPAGEIVVGILAVVICVGTLNAWMLTSGQIALGAAEDSLFPKIFAQKNGQNAPMWGLIFSFFGIIPLLILTSDPNLARRIHKIIDFSVTAFLFVYGACIFSYLKIYAREGFGAIILGIAALSFCGLILLTTPITTLLMSSLFVFSGIPLFFVKFCSKNTFFKERIS